MLLATTGRVLVCTFPWGPPHDLLVQGLFQIINLWFWSFLASPGRPKKRIWLPGLPTAPQGFAFNDPSGTSGNLWISAFNDPSGAVACSWIGTILGCSWIGTILEDWSWIGTILEIKLQSPRTNSREKANSCNKVLQNYSKGIFCFSVGHKKYYYYYYYENSFF